MQIAMESSKIPQKSRRRISAKRKRALAFGRVCEITDGRAVRWRRCGIGAAEAFRLRKAGDPGYFAYLDYMRSVDPREAERIKSAARRPLYYEAENVRRRALAEERRKVRERRTVNECPSAEQIMAAWERVGESHEATLRFGSLLEDLECYVDNSLKFNGGGDIVGRNRGIKGWLHDNTPVLYGRYTAVMRYKAMAKKLRQIAELRDPVPASAILRGEAGKQDHAADETAGARGSAGVDGPGAAVVRARAIWDEVVGGIADNPTALVRRIDELVDPEKAGDANMLADRKSKCANEITLRTKLRRGGS